MGGVSVGDEMSPRQNAQTHTRFYGGEADPTLRMPSRPRRIWELVNAARIVPTGMESERAATERKWPQLNL